MNAGFKGRGAADNPGNRFESLRYDPDPQAVAEDSPRPATQFFRDQSRSLITTNDSPDVGFAASINPYRGCEHGCIYCYARPYHEYLGLSCGLDFETRIFVKEDAPAILRRELAGPRWQPQTLGISGVTDAYQPIEKRLCLTRRCLQVLAEFRNPVIVITKNHLVARDADLLAGLARHQAALVFVSITTLDAALARNMEPRTSSPEARLATLRELSEAKVPVGVMVAPLIPGLNDHEMPSILHAARQAGARHAGYVVLRLPHGVSELFQDWLERQFPEKKAKILARLQELRGGKLNDSRFGTRMKGEGPLAQLYRDLFDVACRKAGMPRGRPQLSCAAFQRPGETPQLLFEGSS